MLSTACALTCGVDRNDKVSKRASNVHKLAMENEKLKEELRAMSEELKHWKEPEVKDDGMNDIAEELKAGLGVM